MTFEEMKVSSTSANPQIPLIVDSVKTAEDFEMTRMSYWVIDFSLEETRPSHVSSASIHILTTGAQGILLGPSDNESVFSSGEILEKTFSKFGESSEISVETASLWLPNSFLADVHSKFTSGDVFRASADVFSLGRRFGKNTIEQAVFVDTISGLDPAQHMRYSQIETRALIEWSRLQIADKRKQYEEMKKDNRPLSYCKGKKGKG